MKPKCSSSKKIKKIPKISNHAKKKMAQLRVANINVRISLKNHMDTYRIKEEYYK